MLRTLILNQVKVGDCHRDSGGIHHEIGIQFYYQQLFDLNIDDYLFWITEKQ